MLSRRILACSILFLSVFSFIAVFNVRSAQAATSAELIGLINNYRASKGLSILAADGKLTNAACWMASDMATNNYFSHTDSLGRNPFTRMDAFGAVGNSRAENLASLTNQGNSSQKIFDGWRASSGHNANMLGPYNRIGVGFAYRSASKTYYWVADFASGAATAGSNECGASPAPRPKPAPQPTPKPAPTQTSVQTQPTQPAVTPNNNQVLASENKVASQSTGVWKPYDPEKLREQYQLGLVDRKTSADLLSLILALVSGVSVFFFLIWIRLEKVKQ